MKHQYLHSYGRARKKSTGKVRTFIYAAVVIVPLFVLAFHQWGWL